jgi:protein-serine/threonine kinase
MFSLLSSPCANDNDCPYPRLICAIMLENDAILKLKRSHSDVDNLVPLGDLTPPNSPGNKTHPSRPSRSFSWSKLTESIKGKGPLSRSSRGSSIDKRPSISSPILNPTNPLCPHTPTEHLEFISPSISVSRIPTAPSSPALRHCYNRPLHTRSSP